MRRKSSSIGADGAVVSASESRALSNGWEVASKGVVLGQFKHDG